MADTQFMAQATALLACLNTHLAAQSIVPGLSCVRTGDVVTQDAGILLDECCAGSAYVRVVSIYPASSDFPNPDTDFALNGCGITGWGLTLEMGVFRCHEVGDANLPPTCEQWTATSQLIMNDAKAMRLAICCFTDSLDSGGASVGAWSPVGPDGNCIGGTMTVTVFIDHCDTC